MPGRITLRPRSPADDAFLREVYASTRAAELALVNWSDAEKAAFLRMQFNAQHQSYQAQFPGADYLVILAGEEPIGRLYLARAAGELRILDLALLPAHRNQGTGSALLNDILAEATAVTQPVRLHVERFNPARRLYERLGFTVIGEGPIYLELEKRM